MSTPLEPVILDVGLSALFNQTQDGFAARITHIALGDDGHTPSRSQTGLRRERARYPVADGRKVSPNQIHVTALADGPESFWVREVGFVLEDGTFLAVWSHPTQILAYKAAYVDLLLAYDLNLQALPADSVTVVSTGANLSLVLAEELAGVATGHISLLRRQVALQDRVDALEDGRSAIAYLLGEKADRSEVERRLTEQALQHTERLAALATGHISLLRRNLELSERIDAVAEQARIARQTADYLWNTYH